MAPRMMPRTNPGVWQLSSAAEVKDKNSLLKLGVRDNLKLHAVPGNISICSRDGYQVATHRINCRFVVLSLNRDCLRLVSHNEF